VKNAVIACSTCGAAIDSLDEHLALIAARRAKFGATWDLPAPRQRYTVDVETEPEIDYTPAEYK
jgi:hypothetical protein